MRRTTAKKGSMTDVASKVTEGIAAALEAGVAPWVKPWHSTSASPLGMPSNLKSGKVYRGVNVLILWISALKQGFSDTRWLTYNQAKALKGHVKKGAKGTQIVFWKVSKQPVAVEAGEGEEEVQAKRGRLFAREYTVFNVEQCEGLELETAAAPAVALPLSESVALLEKKGARILRGGNRACYSPEGDFIMMPPAEDFVDAGAHESILWHEATHWTGHSSRKNRNMGGRFGDESYAFEELVAELGSAFLCAHFGVQGKLQHAEYVGNWAKVLRNDKHAIFTAARLAQEAAEFLLGEKAAAQDDEETAEDQAEEVAEAA